MASQSAFASKASDRKSLMSARPASRAPSGSHTATTSPFQVSTRVIEPSLQRLAKKKGGGIAPAALSIQSVKPKSGFVVALDGEDRTGVLALGGHVAIDELDDGHRGVVAVTEARLHDADVAAVTLGVTRSQRVEQLADLRHVANGADGLTTSVQVALLGEGDQLLDEGTQFLRLRQGGRDLLVLDQRGGHVGEHGLAVADRTAELTIGGAVAHRGLSYSTLVSRPYLADETWGLSFLPPQPIHAGPGRRG